MGIANEDEESDWENLSRVGDEAEPEIVLDGDPPPHVTPGTYLVMGIGHDFGTYMGNDKLYIHFRIEAAPVARGRVWKRDSDASYEPPRGYDDPAGVERLVRHYNIKRIENQGGREKRTGASWGSDYVREWTIAANRKPTRHDRLSPRVFKGAVFLVEVVTVTSDRRGRDTPEIVHYSKVGAIVERRDDT